MKLTLEKPVYGGDCLARLPDTGGKAGKAVFVPLTLPGETVEAHIVEEKRTFTKAELDQVLDPSPHRVAPACAHFGACGGCQYQHAGHPAQLDLKQQILRETLTRAGVAIPAEIAVLSAEPFAYRNRVRLALTASSELAYRSRGSHQLIPIQECPIATPELLIAAKRIAAFCKQHAEKVSVSEVELFTDPDQSHLQIALFSRNSHGNEAQTWLDLLRPELPQKIALRLLLDNGALEPRILAQTGEPSLVYHAAGFDYLIPHGAFFQVNRWLLDRFVPLVISGESGKLAWDLYAGVGLFSSPLTAAFDQVVAVESSPTSLPALRQNLNGAGAAIASTTLDFLRRNRERREPAPGFLILDPPRAGLGGEVTTLLNAVGAPRMTYVSCDPTTLARDLAALTRERYRVHNITLVDMFPQTFHLETVVQLRRS